MANVRIEDAPTMFALCIKLDAKLREKDANLQEAASFCGNGFL